MSTVVLPPRPPWVMVDLDTTGPVLGLEVAGVIQPPDRLQALVSSDEPLADASISFTTSLGQALSLGYEKVDDRHLMVWLDSVGLSAGRGILRVIGRDLAGNTSALDWAVLIDRPRAFDVEATTAKAFEVSAAVTTTYDTETEVLGAFGVDALPLHPFETETGALGAFTTETEMATDG